ncbi:MAG: hypothetical protein ABFD97_18320 [Syntrophobacter sp.]
MANLLSAGLPELKTDYGPDWGKVAAVSHYMAQTNLLKKKQEETEATKQTMGGYVPGGGVNQEMMGNLLKVNPEMAMKVIGAESAMDKRNPEIQAKNVEIQQKALGLARESFPYLKDNPQRWPAFVANMTNLGVPSSFFDIDLQQIANERGIDAYNSILDKLDQAYLKPTERAQLNTPSFHTFQEGDTKRTVVTTPATGMAMTPIAEAPASEPPKASTAPMHVQDPNSPTGWSYADLLGNVTPGAPAPASDVNKMDPFKASQRISDIEQKRVQIAGALDKLKKGTVITSLIAQSLDNPALEGQKVTDQLIEETKSAYQKSTAAWNREIGLLKPYAEAAPAAQPGSRSVLQGMPVARGVNQPQSGKPQYIRNKTTGEVRKLNPSTGQYEPVR